jgi:hypothetical protein
MAAKTTWGPAPWLPKQTWLLKDNSVVQTPDLETTTSGQRVRIAGTTTSFGKKQIDDMLAQAVKDVAATRLTTPWIKLIDDDQERRNLHGQNSPGPGRSPDFTKAENLHCAEPSGDNKHTQIVFEFEMEECPAVTAMVWVIINRRGYGDNDRTEILSGITYQIVHERFALSPSGYGWSGDRDAWYKPYSPYEHGPDVDEGRAFLRDFEPIPDFKLINDTHPGARGAVLDALKMIKTLKDVEYIEIPVWRENFKASAGRYKLKRTNLTSRLYQDMVEFVQTRPTLERIRENYRQIQKDMTALGIVMAQKSNNDFLEIVEQGFVEDVVCHMIPMKEDPDGEDADGDGKPQIVQDHAHTISVDLLSGTIVVNCAQGDTEVLEHWNFERTKAELHGELDAFLGFARQKQQRRVRKTFNKIMKDRTPEEVDTDDLTA